MELPVAIMGSVPTITVRQVLFVCARMDGWDKNVKKVSNSSHNVNVL